MDSVDGQFMFLMRGADWGGGMTPDEIADGLKAMFSWIEDMRDQGHILGGDPLTDQGTVVTHKAGSVVDGPFVESKEAVGGYLLLRAETFEEACALARQCPVLQYGLQIEVRRVATACHLADVTNVPMPDLKVN